MEFFFGLQIAAIVLALLAHFVGFLRARLRGSSMRSRARLFSYTRMGLLEDTTVEQATYPG